MLSISPPKGAGVGKNYFKKDDYYLEEKGVWLGRGAAYLGLSGGIEQAPFMNVLMGCDKDGNPLIAKKEGVFDPGHRNFGKDQAYIDLTFSAPKSVSIMTLADKEIKKAHDHAVNQVVGFLEENTMQTRLQHNKKREIINTGNLVAGKFDHITSRELDPQLHSHIVLMNMTRTREGWRSVYNNNIFKNKIDLGRLYRNELAHHLQKMGYGIDITDRKKSFFEIQGVPEELIKAFSTRRQQLEERVDALKSGGQYKHIPEAKLYAMAALQSRKNKRHDITRGDLLTDWEGVIKSRGYALGDLKTHVREQAEKNIRAGASIMDILSGFFGWNRHHQTQKDAAEVIHEASLMLTENEAVFKKEKILAESARISLGQYALSDLENSYSAMLDQGSLVYLGQNKSVDYYSTRHMKEVEDAVIKMVENSKQQYRPLVSPEAVEKGVDRQEKKQGWEYTQGQKKAMETILTSPDRINIIQGDAGTGKTTYLKQVKTILEKHGGNLVGIGFTGKSVSELESIGVDSMTIDSFLLQKDMGKMLKPGKTVLLMDEASMTGNYLFHDVLKQSEKNNVKLVVQGDRKQFPSIAAGRMHDILQEKTSVDKVNITEVVRQKPGSNAWQYVRVLEKKGLISAIETIKNQGNIHQVPDADDRMAAITKTAVDSYVKDENVLVLTDTNKDRKTLNETIRDELISRGRVDKNGHEFEVRTPANMNAVDASNALSYRTGQHIVIRENINRKMGSGDMFRVVDTDRENNTITMKNLSSGERVELDVGVKQHWRKISAFDVEKREFSENDNVIFLKNDKTVGVKNGDITTIRHIDSSGEIETVDSENRVRKFNITDPNQGYNYMDQAYAVTLYKSQGATVDRTIVNHDAGLGITSANATYVGITRSRYDTVIFTDDMEKLKEQSREWLVKTSTLDDEYVVPGSNEKNENGEDAPDNTNHENELDIRPFENEKVNEPDEFRIDENDIQKEVEMDSKKDKEIETENTKNDQEVASGKEWFEEKMGAEIEI